MDDYYKLIANKPELFNNANALLKVVTDEDVIRNWTDQKKVAMSDEGMPAEWAEIGIVYHDPYITLFRDLVSFPGGNLGSYFRIINTADLNGGQGAAILPMMGSKVILLRQFRHATREWHWEIPRGFGEPNTDVKVNAMNEIRDEINGVTSNLVYLGPYHSNTGLERTTVALFLASLDAIGEPNKGEGIEEYASLDPSKLEEMIRDAEVTDGFTIAAYTRAKLKGLI